MYNFLCYVEGNGGNLLFLAIIEDHRAKRIQVIQVSMKILDILCDVQGRGWRILACIMLPRKTSFQTRSQWLFFNQSKLPTGWMLRVLERTMGCWAREELLLQCNIHYHRHTQGIRPCHFHDRRMICRLCMRIVHTRHGHSHPQCPSSYYCFHLLFDLLLNDSVLLGNLGDCQHTYANSLHCSRGSNQCYLSTSDRIPSKLCSISPCSLHNHRNASLHKRNE